MSTLTVLVASLALVLVYTGQPAEAKEFVVHKEKLNWFNAYQDCRQRGEKLASILSAEEQQSLEALVQSDIDENNIWIALNDLGEEGKFKWFTSGAHIDYKNWAPNQPDNKHGKEDCVSLVRKEGWKWNDNKCEEEFFYICEPDPVQQ